MKIMIRGVEHGFQKMTAVAHIQEDLGITTKQATKMIEQVLNGQVVVFNGSPSLVKRLQEVGALATGA